MKTSEYISLNIDRLPKDYVVTYTDLITEVNKKKAIIGSGVFFLILYFLHLAPPYGCCHLKSLHTPVVGSKLKNPSLSSKTIHFT